MIFYFIMILICAVASAVLFEIFGPKVDTDDYVALCCLGSLLACFWPIELFIGFVFGTGMLTRHYIKKRKEKKNENER